MVLAKLKLLAVFFLTTLVVSAKEYHVSVKGNDANDGSQLRPFKTISAASNVAMPGDVITVHAGIYREQIVPQRGGNSDRERIVYQAAEGEQVDVRGSEIITGWQKAGNDTWVVKIPNSFFGKFNPFNDLIRGDWYWPPKNVNYHTGAVYLNGDWLMEAKAKEDVMKPTEDKSPYWFSSVDSTTTTVWAQFKNIDPNKETTEVNVRQTVFYPDKPFINYITIRGFSLQHAATNWAPPTAEQMGLVGTHWSKGWIIENNIIQYSKCVGISLGKYGDKWDNKDTESAVGYVGTINRALAFGWNKGTIGGHIVRNNTIAYCEQAGLVGSLGCSFSLVEGNTIHDIHIRKLFGGAEMAGIKFHGAIDVQIRNNHIYRADMGVWLDWMAQNAQISNNLMHENRLDIFLEVNHGPMLVANNLLLSKTNLLMNSSGAAFAHNLFGGNIEVISYDSRLTPYLKPHSTFVAALHDNPGGDIQFFNNVFVKGASAAEYQKGILPVTLDGNVYAKGAIRAISGNKERTFGEISPEGKAKVKDIQDQLAVESNFLIGMDDSIKLVPKNGKMFLEITLDKNWLNKQKRQLVTGKLLGHAMVSKVPFDNPDGSEIVLDMDYFGRKRNTVKPSPGPFEIVKSGWQQIRIW